VKPYTLVSREHQQENTLIKLGQAVIGGPDLIVMAGPCAVEDRDEYLRRPGSCRSWGPMC
jgi:3-deoxy-7-phosphoheptulonate synthase